MNPFYEIVVLGKVVEETHGMVDGHLTDPTLLCDHTATHSEPCN